MPLLRHTGQPGCTKISNFVVHKALDFGIYYQGRASVEIDNVLVTDSILGVITIIPQ